MSAWIVTQRHIALLVEALYRYEIATPADGTPDTIGQHLWQVNHDSVNYRYDRNEPCPAYIHDSAPVRALVQSPSLVFKQIACYGYQSCEHRGWDNSQAHQWMQRLEAATLAALGVDETYEARELPSWQTDPWGIDDGIAGQTEE